MVIPSNMIVLVFLILNRRIILLKTVNKKKSTIWDSKTLKWRLGQLETAAIEFFILVFYFF